MAPQPAAKGYKPQRTLYKLDFSDTEHAGLEVTARGTSMGGLLRLMEIADELDGLEELDTAANAKEIGDKMRELFAPFARVLVEWNVIDDDDQPVPASLEGLMSQEPEFVGFVLTKYCAAMTQAPPPLPATSASGTSSPEALAAAASLSRSPGS